jgi:hypothetical protein
VLARTYLRGQNWKVRSLFYLFVSNSNCNNLNNRFTFVPEIFVSVLALGTADQFKVLFQGIQLRADTLKDTLSLFGREFSLFENEIAAQRRDQSQQNISNVAQQQSGSGSDLGAMIQMSMLALNLLPAGD